MRILSVDPGPSTGIAWYRPIGESFGSFIADSLDAWKWLSESVMTFDLVVCESFHIVGPRAESSNETIETIGVVRYLCCRNELPLEMQTPASSHGFDPRWEKLRAHGWYVPSRHDHANSAARHLMFACVRYGLIGPREVAARG